MLANIFTGLWHQRTTYHLFGNKHDNLLTLRHPATIGMSWSKFINETCVQVYSTFTTYQGSRGPDIFNLSLWCTIDIKLCHPTKEPEKLHSKNRAFYRSVITFEFLLTPKKLGLLYMNCSAQILFHKYFKNLRVIRPSSKIWVKIPHISKLMYEKEGVWYIDHLPV